MLPDDAKIISVDDHVIEHPRVWLDRLPGQVHGSRAEEREAPDGNDTWVYEGAVRQLRAERGGWQEPA